jgi:hypothetical protein
MTARLYSNENFPLPVVTADISCTVPTRRHIRSPSLMWEIDAAGTKSGFFVAASQPIPTHPLHQPMILFE